MAKKARSHDDETDVTTNQEEGSQDTTSVTGGPEVNAGNPPTGAGDPAPEHQDEQNAQNAQQADGDPNRPQTQDEIDADKQPLSKDEALQLLKAGHRLRAKGDSPANWVAMTRHGGDLAISYAATDEAVDHFLGDAPNLILAE